MNYITEEIMKLLGVDQTKALAIQKRMGDIFEMNYSECSQRTLNRCIRSAAKQLDCKHEWDTALLRSGMCIYCGAVPTKEERKLVRDGH